MINFEDIKKFKELEPKLCAIIEEHLPGDFSNWEKKNTTWAGDIKTIHNAGKDPRAEACAWALYSAAYHPDLLSGIIRLAPNEAALVALDKGLNQAVEALKQLALPARLELSKASKERFVTQFEPPNKDLNPPDVLLILMEEAMREGVVAARSLVNREGEESKANLRAACVVEVCCDVFERRSGKSAPKSVNDDHTTKKSGGEPVPFVRFVKAIFGIFDITSRVDSALVRRNMIRRQP